MNPPFSRRATLQAAGATVLAAGLTGTTATAATAARAGETGGAARLVTYPVPAGAPVKTDSFTVKVRRPGGRWRRLGTYLATLNLVDTITGSGRQQNSTLAQFDFSGSVEVEVTCLKGGVEKVRVRPDSYGITPKVRGNTVRSRLTEPRNLIVQVDDQIFDCLHLLARPLGTDRPAADDPDVIHFGPGVHTTPEGTLTVPSGKTVHLDGGAVLKSRVIFKDVENAGLTGRGVIHAAPGGGATVEGSKNITRLVSRTGATAADRVGLLMTKSLSPFDQAAGAIVTGGTTAQLMLRPVVAGPSAFTGSGRLTLPCLLRLKRTGTVFAAAASTDDGATWVPLAEGTVPGFGDAPYHVGLVVCSRDPLARTTTRFDRVHLTPTPAPAQSGAPQR